MESWARKKTRKRRALEILAVIVFYIFIAAALIVLTLMDVHGKQPEGPQICGSDNRWRSTGMQYWPDYIDWQP